MPPKDVPGAGGTDKSESDYLSQLANSILQKKSVYLPPTKGRSPAETPVPVSPPPVPTPMTPPAGGAPSRHSQSAVPRLSPRSSSTPLPSDIQSGSYPVGTILLFEDETIGIFKSVQKDKDYELIYLLQPDGRVAPQGMALFSYEVRAIGELPPEFVDRMGRTNRWERDVIVFHLSHFDYCALIPHPAGMDSRVTSGSGVPKISLAALESPQLERGRFIRVSFGKGQEWHAVYWGEDELGTIVAHDTNRKWTLMHLDLKRFQDSLVIGEMAAPEVKAAISRDVAEH